jgi:polysaccharide export outer membrane protein
MSAILRKLSSDSTDWLGKVEPYSCRVGNDGTITLPIVGKIPAAGKTLAEVESSVVDAYYPKYVVDIPAVVCKVTEHLNERVFTVLGLVNKPDAFPYLPNVRYNLMEALAFAGGVNSIADPHYVNVYRQSANGQIVSATFRIDQEFLIGAYDVVIKPGDVVYVSETARTRMNTFMNDVLNINVGAYARPFDD